MGFSMGDMSVKVLKTAQELASDLLKRRWPNRYIGRPMISVDDCICGLVEMGALDSAIVEHSTKRLALIHWMLNRIQSKANHRQDDTSFYRSSAWRKVRYSVLAQSDRKCLICGTPQSDGAILHVDHIKPRSKYPELALDASNLRVLCEDCNVGKSDSELE